MAGIGVHLPGRCSTCPECVFTSPESVFKIVRNTHPVLWPGQEGIEALFETAGGVLVSR